jgi:hypothetical protein
MESVEGENGRTAVDRLSAKRNWQRLGGPRPLHRRLLLSRLLLAVSRDTDSFEQSR